MRWTGSETYDASQIIDVSYEAAGGKSALYCGLLRAMMADQVAWIRDRGHQRVVTEANGLESLRMASAADSLAHAQAGDPR